MFDSPEGKLSQTLAVMKSFLCSRMATLLRGGALLAALAVSVRGLNRPLAVGQRLPLVLLAAAALFQWLLGISALLLAVPVWLGALHQAGAILLLTAALNALYRLRGP